MKKSTCNNENLKSSISNEDIFDRIDRDLCQLRFQSINHEINIDKLESRFSLLNEDLLFNEKSSQQSEKSLGDILLNFEERINKLEREKFEKIEINSNIINNYNRLLKFVKNLSKNTYYSEFNFNNYVVGAQILLEFVSRHDKNK